MKKEKSTASVLAHLGRDLPADTRLFPLADVPGGYALHIREPFYTSVALSSLEKIRVRINDCDLEESQLALRLREQTIPAAVCRNIHELYWHMGETAELLLTMPAAETLPARSRVQLEIVIRPSYNYNLPEGCIVYSADLEMEVA